MGYFSNGTEGAIFEEQWCSRCVHSDLHRDKEIGDHDNPPCPVWMAHLLFAYELCNEKDHTGKVVLDMLMPIKTIETSDGYGIPGNECAMFHQRAALASECDGSSDCKATVHIHGCFAERAALASEEGEET